MNRRSTLLTPPDYLGGAENYGPAPKLVLAHGTFDLLHLGHIRHLQQARSWGDRLVVSVTADEHVNKGNGRPHFTAQQRVEALKALDCVDDAFINHDPDPTHAIEQLVPDLYVKGIDYIPEDYQGRFPEGAVCARLGIEIRYTNTEKWSSSRLINAEKFPEHVIRYLEDARPFLPRILQAFEAADKLKMVFIGEDIIDSYIYVRAIGKASKEPIIATAALSSETFEGGTQAAAKQGEWKSVEVITAGSKIWKTRYVDADFSRKLFEVYSATDVYLENQQRDEFNIVLDRAVREFDVVVMLDFGHGLMRRQERKTVTRAKFLGLNAQSNAGNHGYNPVTLYDRANFICIDDPEARLAVAMPHEPIDHVISALTEKINCRQFIVTHGRHGSCFYGDRYGSAPAFTSHGLDTMGAGDAVLAVTAPLLAAGLGLEEAAFVGNVVGACKVSILGHRTHVTRQEIITTVESLLK